MGPGIYCGLCSLGGPSLQKGRDTEDKSTGELLRQQRRGGDKKLFVSLAAHFKGYVYKTRAGLIHV